MTPPRRTVLVLGAQGRFGAAAVDAFAAAGWQVLAQQRRAPAAALPGTSAANVRTLALDLADTAAAARAAAGAQVLVYAVNPVYTAWSRELLPLARQGMALAERLNARFMLPGNVYNFGAGMPALLHEDTPQQPTSVKGRLRVALEDELAERAARPGAGLRSVVIRAGDFFGSGRGSWLDLVIAKSLRSGKLVYPGPLEVMHAWAYLPDLARAFVAVAEAPDVAAFERLHFGGHSATGAQWLAAVESASASLGLAQPPLQHGGMPWPLLRAFGWAVPNWRELAEMAYLWQVPHALDGSTLERRVGVLPTTPLATALQRSLAELHRLPAAPLAASIPQPQA